MSDDGKVVFLAFTNRDMRTGVIQRLACGSCNNKTYTVTYDDATFDREQFPQLKCACCGADCGRIGWAPAEDKE